MSSQSAQKLQESETAPVQWAFGIEFAQQKQARGVQEPDDQVDVTSEASGKPMELPTQDSKKGIEWARQKLARKERESEERAAPTPEVFVKPVEIQSPDSKEGIEWARHKLCKEVHVYDEPQDSIFSSDLDIDLIAAMIEARPVAGADGIAYARSILASDADECIDDQEPVKHEDGISYARSLLSRDSGVVKEELKPVREPEKPESVGGMFSVMERDVETCRAVAAFLRSYYSSRYNLV